MVVLPAATPVTMPVAEPTDAVAGAADDHVPPLTASPRVVVAASQTAAVPVIVPALGSGLTVTTLVVTAVPQELE